MAQTRMTVIGLENYLSYFNKSLFEGVTFPDGIDKDMAISEIVLECGEFEVLYSNPDFFTEAITLWSKTRYYTFEKWLEAINAKFSPIENYDRYEEYTDGETTGNTLTNDLTNTHDMTDTNDVSAYDASTYQPKDKQHTGGTIKNEGTITNEGSRELTHNAHIHGNIGVTMGSQMVNEYIALYGDKNIYQLIATDFVTRFTIMVY